MLSETCGRAPVCAYNINKYSLIKILTALAPLVIGGCAGQAETAQTAQPVSVQAAMAASDQAAADAVSGVVESAVPMVASAVGSGRVIAIAAQVGDTVRKGQLLAMLDARAASLRAAQLEAEVRRAAALAEDRAANAARMGQMIQGGSVSAAEQSAALAEARAAAAALAAARAAAGAARQEAADMRILSPGDGVIARRSIEVGAVATPGQALFTIDQARGTRILAAVPQQLAATLQRGATVGFSGSGQSGRATILGISPRVEDGGVVPVYLGIVEGAASPGSVVAVALFAGQTAAVAGTSRIPVGAMLTARDGSRYVYTIERARASQGLAVRRMPVELIGISGVDARVRAPGLAGRSIVSAGGAFLQPGQRVQIVRPGT